MKSTYLAVLLVIALPAAALAQGLGDAATRERGKREKRADKPASRVYTDEDLLTEEEKNDEQRKRDARSASPAGTAKAGAGSSEAAGSEEGSPGAPSGVIITPPQVVRRAYEETGNETEEEVRDIQGRGGLAEESTNAAGTIPGGVDDSEARRAAVQGQAAQAQTALKDAQDTLRPLQEKITGIQQELSPFNPNFNQDPNRILQLQADMTAAQKQLEAAQKQLDAAQQGWEAVLEAARRAGVPASEITPR